MGLEAGGAPLVFCFCLPSIQSSSSSARAPGDLWKHPFPSPLKIHMVWVGLTPETHLPILSSGRQMTQAWQFRVSDWTYNLSLANQTALQDRLLGKKQSLSLRPWIQLC